MNGLKIFDTHAHYDDRAFDSDRENIIESLKEKNVLAVTDIGCDMKSSEAVDALTKKYDFFYGAVGVIPAECKDMKDEDLDRLREIAQSNKKIVAIGEIGLDYYWEDNPERDIQKKWFRAQLDLAGELDLPVVIHSRDAAEDTVDILIEYFGDKDKRKKDGAAFAGEIPSPGVIHCYSYSRETAEILMKTGMYFGIGGVVTYKNAKKLVRAVEAIPMDRIVLETDCPYLTPTPHRGERNYSGYLIHVIEKLAEIKEISPEEVARITWDNACRLYRI
ncbi:MAG: TatD family hydrolase [Eubacterium sp.]|nr:TatD family hydrolase [Eubacterium sp.]